METFKIEIQESLKRVVEVEALNTNEAIEIVENEYKKCIHVLDYNDFVEVNFIDIDKECEIDKKEKLTMDLIDYLWNDEEKHFEESDYPVNHIFLKIKELKSKIRNSR